LEFGNWCLSSCLLQQIGNFVGKLPSFEPVGVIRIDKRDGLDIAKGHTLRIAITIVAFYSDPLLGIKERLAERTGDDTGPAPDAEILIDDHPVILFRFPMAGPGRTNLNTVGLFTMIAGHGKVEAHLFPFDHSDPGTARIACSGVIDRANQLALATARAFFLIDHQYLLLHLGPLSQIFKLEARNSKFETISNDQNRKFKTRE
jgi:hypothetical protein